MVDRPSRGPRVAWNASTREDESRTYLQARLAILSKVLFFCFAAFLVFMFGIYQIHPELKPAWSDVTFGTNVIGVAMVGLLWWRLRRSDAMTMRALMWVDAVYAGGVGVFLGFNAFFGTDLLFAPFTCLLFACLSVLMRAIIVPSTGRWTAVLSSMTLGSMVIASIAIVINGWPIAEKYAPPVALVGTVVSICLLVGLLAAVGSQTSYGLRQDARAAKQLGQYTLDRKIADGGMGSVYIAHHVLLRRPTAIKLILPNKLGPDMLDRFMREVRATSELTHPNTVAVFDYGRNPDGIFYYAMEYLDGINLQHLVEHHGPQPQQRVIEIVKQVAGALHEAHAKGLVHRDVKPGNIMLCERGTMPDIAKVLDFGLVKETAADSAETQQVLVGTPGYIAPETITDAQLVSPAADVYALGAVAYFLLAGKRVFEGNSPIDICVKHVTESPAPLAGVAPALARLVEQCLGKSPATRPTTIEIVHALRSMTANDWSENQAQTWWSDFRTKRAAAPVNAPTQTITVDIGRRERELISAQTIDARPPVT